MRGKPERLLLEPSGAASTRAVCAHGSGHGAAVTGKDSNISVDRSLDLAYLNGAWPGWCVTCKPDPRLSFSRHCALFSVSFEGTRRLPTASYGHYLPPTFCFPRDRRTFMKIVAARHDLTGWYSALLAQGCDGKRTPANIPAPDAGSPDIPGCSQPAFTLVMKPCSDQTVHTTARIERTRPVLQSMDATFTLRIFRTL
jgi:hypothetical protein